MSADREAAIRELAKAVEGSSAHGRWDWRGGYPQTITNGAATLVAEVFADPDAPPTLVEFIAACDPETILWLLAELADAREENALRVRDLQTASMRVEAAEGRETKLREALRPIVREYDLWAEDANDGEFRLWDLDRLCVAIVNARALLADGEGET